MTQIKEIIRAFIIGNTIMFDEEIELNDSENIFESGFVNSLFALQLIRFIEKDFNIELSSDEINPENFSSVENIVRMIERSKNG